MDEVVFRLVPAMVAVILLWCAYWWIWRSTRRREPRFTTEAQRAIRFARVEAERLRSATIDPVHLLLGLLHVPLPTIVRYLPLEEHATIRQEVEEHVGGGAIVDYRDDLPFSEDARKVLVAAAREARSMDARQIGAEHLLLGLLHSDSVAALILRERGLRLEPLRAQVGGWQA